MAHRHAAWLALALAGAATAGWAAEAPAPAGALARYREAHEALAGGDFALAQARFESLPPDFLLADYAAYFVAESLLRAGEEAPALERLRGFPDRFPESVLVPAALLGAADTAFRLGRWAEAIEGARRFLARAPGHPEAGRVLIRLAEARAAQGAVGEALTGLRRRWLEAPASPWGVAARETLDDLAALHGVAVPPLTAEEQLLHAQRLVEANELTRAVRVLEGVLAQESEPGVRHRAVLRLAPALGRLQRGPDAVARLQASLGEPPTLLLPALLAELGRQLRRTNQAAAAVPVFERLLADHPDSPLAPEAWLALARARLELGHREARAVFQSLIRAHPDSVAAAAAGWEVAWLDYRAGRFRDAALAFRQLSSAAAGYRLAGLYWAARALDAVPQKGTATALYREIVARAPNAYYGILAARRLRGARPAPAAAPLRLAADPLALLERDPHYQKGRALWSLGQEGFAVVEFETLARDGLVEPERAWSLGVAFAQLGEAGRSLRYLRRGFGPAAEANAPGLTPEFWRLYYPLGYADLVRTAARRVGLDPFFVAAVIREESSFDPRARSWVGAIGLMQLMPDTARVVAADAGVRLGEAAGLWEPPVNIALGAQYLAQLRGRFQEPLFAVAGYNAGPHRVQRWLADRPATDLEEWVDLIPFDETRAFVKRVSTSWHHYRRLYGPPEPPPRRGEAEAMPRAPR